METLSDRKPGLLGAGDSGARSKTVPTTQVLLIATGSPDLDVEAQDRTPTPLLEIAGRSVIVRVLEALSERGCDRAHLFLKRAAPRIRELLGDGTRWGMRLTYELVADGESDIVAVKRHVEGLEDAAVILGRGDVLPLGKLDRLFSGAPVLLRCQRRQAWTGWARVSPPMLARIPDDATFDQKTLALRGAMEHFGGTEAFDETVLDGRRFEALLRANREVLAGVVALGVPGQEVEPGIWLGPNVLLPPTATLVPPVIIGENCRIGARSQVGPDAVVAADCSIGDDTIVSNSIIMSRTYVGEGLEVSHCVVDPAGLVNVLHGASVTVTDAFIVGPIDFGQDAVSHLDRAVALAIGLLLAPLIAVIALVVALTTRGRVFQRTDVVRVPATSDRATWKTCSLLTFRDSEGPLGPWLESSGIGRVPSLLNVALGQIHLNGQPPRTALELAALPADTRARYLEGQAGVFRARS